MPSKPWEEVLGRLDVLAFYTSEHVELRTHGESYATGLCPFHDDHAASLSVSLETGKRGMFRCHACGEKGSPFDFFQKRHNTDFPTALREVAKFAPGVNIDERPSAKAARMIVATYTYMNAAGEPVHRTVRYQPKSFMQQRFENGEWKYGLRGVEPVLYRLPEVMAEVPQTQASERSIFVVEGEKDADNLSALGVVATTCPMGAGKWRRSYTDVLAGASVVLLPDNDEPGRKHMIEVARDLVEAQCRVRVINLPGVPPKGDVSDWIGLGGDAQTLAFIVSTAKEWKPAKKGPSLERISEVIPVEVDWIWDQHIPCGKLSLIVGDPGLGKSTVTLDLAARISTGGVWPDRGNATKGDVLLLSAEDGLADTIAPRLIKLGADRSRVYAMTGVTEEDGTSRWFTLDKDLAHVATAIEEIKPVMVVIDPINAYLGDVDAHQDAQVRRVLNPLQDMAERYGCAIVGVMHLNKNTQTKADYRVGGSIAYTAAARSVSYVVADPQEDDKRYFVTHKMNLAARPPAMAFRLNGSIAWETDLPKGFDLEEMLLARSPKDDSQLDEAMEFLDVEIGSEPVSSVEVFRRGHQELGLSERTMRRAKDMLDWLVTKKIGERWFLVRKQDGHVPPSRKDGQDGHLGHVDENAEEKTAEQGQINLAKPDDVANLNVNQDTKKVAKPDDVANLKSAENEATAEEKREDGQDGQDGHLFQGGQDGQDDGDEDLPHWNRG